MSNINVVLQNRAYHEAQLKILPFGDPRRVRHEKLLEVTNAVLDSRARRESAILDELERIYGEG